MSLTTEQVQALERLADEQARGEAISWDEPKTVGGVVVRPIESITYIDRNDKTEKTKRVLTLKTADGIRAIFEGPDALNGRLFAGERRKDDPNPLGPPKTGDLVIVTYRGERMSEVTGRTFKSFDVARSSAAEPLPADDDNPPTSDALSVPTGGADEIPF